MLEQYNQVEGFFKCTHKFEPLKPNFKEKCDKWYKFHVLGHKVTCTICELSVCRRCALKLFNFTFEKREKTINSPSYNFGTDSEKKVIA